jgi:hypothetical protein
MQTNDIAKLITSELERVSDLSRRERLKALLIEPRLLSLHWDYNPVGTRFDCWLIGQSPNGDTRLVYCNQGFGPSFPWGFVYSDTDSMGNDGQWEAGLEDVAINCGLLDAPENYESPGPRA